MSLSQSHNPPLLCEYGKRGSKRGPDVPGAWPTDLHTLPVPVWEAGSRHSDPCDGQSLSFIFSLPPLNALSPSPDALLPGPSLVYLWPKKISRGERT